MFHNVLPTNENGWNHETYGSYNVLELCGFSVDLNASAAELNSSELFSNFQAFPSQETVEHLSLNSNTTDEVDVGLFDFTSVMTSTFEDNMASSIVPGYSPVLMNSWDINSNSHYQTNLVNGRKRPTCEPIFPHVTVDGIPGYSENQPPREESTGSKPKRRRAQNARQRKEANVREKKRMENLNQAFDSLKTKVPTFSSEKRLSRMETLRHAIDYISFLKDVLADKNTSDNMRQSPESPNALDSIDISFTLGDLEALQITDSLYTLDYTGSSDSGNSSS